MSRVFDGSLHAPNTNSIQTPASGVYNNLTALTLAAWIYPTASNGNFGMIAVKAPGITGSPSLNFSSSDLAIDSAVYNSTFATPAHSLTNAHLLVNAWSHVAMTWDLNGDKKVHIYINGVEGSYSAQTTFSGSLPDDSANGYAFGDDGFSDNISARIAEEVIFNVALSAGQIASLAASTSGVPGSLPAPVGYWHLLGTASPEPDSSGHSNSGVLSSPNPPTQGPDSPGYAPVFSVPDCRVVPNHSRNVQGTVTYDVCPNDSRTAGAPVDSRAGGAPTDSRVSPNIPENSRTP